MVKSLLETSTNLPNWLLTLAICYKQLTPHKKAIAQSVNKFHEQRERERELASRAILCPEVRCQGGGGRAARGGARGLRSQPGQGSPLCVTPGLAVNISHLLKIIPLYRTCCRREIARCCDYWPPSVPRRLETKENGGPLLDSKAYEAAVVYLLYAN
ncbi:hypothetical protein EVAR_31657_1 [Eumeta japonica]|uniref:Uncharacterized protein n=1 Tax=Eumeta variegata TaxID=151549 RepID=A0A4C1VZH8_EUMVA|nr:hypothetical protein EVAR_31657_1 [Eumeta japonica]